MKKILSGILALVILLTCAGFAEGSSAYITLSDLYFTDSVNAVDLTGLSVNLKLSVNPDFVQLLLSLFTGTDEVSAAIEADNQAVYLYGDGFHAPYAITFASLSQMLSQLGPNIDASVLKPEVLFAAGAQVYARSDEAIGVSNLIYQLYSEILGDASQIQNAKVTTVATFTHESMSAFAVPLEIDAEALDAWLLDCAKALDSDETARAALAESMPADVYSAEGEAPSYEQLYTEIIRPLGLSISGNVYYGEEDIFLDIALYKEGVEFIPLNLEITNSEAPVLYMNIPLLMEDQEIIIYSTIEATQDCSSEYVEVGVLNNGATAALVMYQKGVSEDGSIPAYDFYAGAAAGTDVFEISAYYESDEKTARKIVCGVNLGGVMLELNYDGTISLSGEESAEVGELKLSSNIGVAGKVRLGFGSGAFDAASLISDPGSVVVFSNMTQEQADGFMADINQLVENALTALLQGVPGFAALLAADVPAEG